MKAAGAFASQALIPHQCIWSWIGVQKVVGLILKFIDGWSRWLQPTTAPFGKASTPVAGKGLSSEATSLTIIDLEAFNISSMQRGSFGSTQGHSLHLAAFARSACAAKKRNGSHSKRVGSIRGDWCGTVQAIVRPSCGPTPLAVHAPCW